MTNSLPDAKQSNPYHDSITDEQLDSLLHRSTGQLWGALHQFKLLRMKSNPEKYDQMLGQLIVAEALDIAAALRELKALREQCERMRSLLDECDGWLVLLKDMDYTLPAGLEAIDKLRGQIAAMPPSSESGSDKP
jgi:hypothetical protein